MRGAASTSEAVCGVGTTSGGVAARGVVGETGTSVVGETGARTTQDAGCGVAGDGLALGAGAEETSGDLQVEKKVMVESEQPLG